MYCLTELKIAFLRKCGHEIEYHLNVNRDQYKRAVCTNIDGETFLVTSKAQTLALKKINELVDKELGE